MGTGVAMRLGGEARKGLRLTMSLGHAHWSMTHSHTRAISPRWEKKRAETMAQPPPTGGERGVFYPNFLLPNEPQVGGTRPIIALVPPRQAVPHAFGPAYSCQLFL